MQLETVLNSPVKPGEQSTVNIQHRTSEERRNLALSVECWMFDVSVSQIN